jgi:flagellin
MISVLNSISSLVAENALSSTQANLQTTLQQLSTGLRINSGADDPAGLSIAQGLGANIAALTQSGQNATDGIGVLQTADGALSQVNTILNQAVTIATEASNGGLSSSQASALNTQFQSILSEINQIGQTTNFNGTSVFAATTPDWTSQQGSAAAPLLAADDLTAGSVTTVHDAQTGGTFVYTAASGDTIGDLETAIGDAVGTTLATGTTVSLASGQLVISGPTGDSLQVSTNDSVLGPFSASGGSGGSLNVFTSDGTSSGSATTTATIGALSASALGLTSTMNLSSTSAAQTALSAVTAAINTVSQSRGNIGASVNALTSDSNVESTEVQNLTSAQNNIQNANIATTTSNLAQYNILEQTGFDALSQSQAAEQNVLKLLQ